MTYDDVYADYERSPTLRILFGQGYPPDVEPFSFVPLAGLAEVARLVFSVRPSAVLVDLGCGRGGPGKWVADRLGARLTGVDSSEVAIEQAGHRFADELYARFIVGTFEHTGLPDAAADAMICVDAFRFATDQELAVQEIRRITKPGSKIVLTGWNRPGEPPLRRAFDESPGLEVLDVLEHPEWEVRRRRIYTAALESDVRDDPALDRLRSEARSQLPSMTSTRRVAVVVTRA